MKKMLALNNSLHLKNWRTHRNRNSGLLIFIAFLYFLVGCAAIDIKKPGVPDTRRWLAGDHHIHSRYSVGWDKEQNPPSPIIGGQDAISPIQLNALMGKYFGLSWMVATDHGGPNHSKVNLELAYPELVLSRKVVKDVIQFYGMEFDTPGAEHSTLIIPHSPDEAEILCHLESRFDILEAFPRDPLRNSDEKMTEALEVMKALERQPLIIVNHPSRTASGDGKYGRNTPAKMRQWNDIAPVVAVGMAGAPGHQALAISNHPLVKNDRLRIRGGYFGFSTLGGFDQMTAKLGGFWDSMLGEGRHWWITANSDFHQHYSEKGGDFWPGEYTKTYVYATKDHDSILAAIRAGHMFVTLGDLINELFIEVAQDDRVAFMGEELIVSQNSQVTVNIRVRDPNAVNPGGYNPEVKRIDLIVGQVSGMLTDPNIDKNDTTHVAHRFTALEWTREDEYLTMSCKVPVGNSLYIRVRGTNTDELEPERDPPGENPWNDLWFYSNPVFVTIQ